MRVTARFRRKHSIAHLGFKGKDFEVLPLSRKKIFVTVSSSPVTLNINGDPSLTNRLQALESLIAGLNVFTVSAPVNVLDDVETTVSIAVIGIKEADDYMLVFNNTNQGLRASLSSWQDDEVSVTVHNNTGRIINETLEFKINQILKPL